MINYAQKETYVAVRWKKTEIGRIQSEGGGYVYSPRGCGGAVKSEALPDVDAVKHYIEKEKVAINFYYG